MCFIMLYDESVRVMEAVYGVVLRLTYCAIKYNFVHKSLSTDVEINAISTKNHKLEKHNYNDMTHERTPILNRN